MLTEYGCTEDELIQTYGQDNVEQSIMLNRVSNLILGKCKCDRSTG